MKQLSGNKAAEFIESLIHLDTQLNGKKVDLTVAEMYRPTHPGSLDFGGSEYQPAPRERLTPEKKNEGDKYGWWNLVPGTYIVEFNEKIKHLDQGFAMIIPHTRLLKTGASIPTHIPDPSDDKHLIPMQVAENGCNIKENARIASLLYFKES